METKKKMPLSLPRFFPLTQKIRFMLPCIILTALLERLYAFIIESKTLSTWKRLMYVNKRQAYLRNSN